MNVWTVAHDKSTRLGIITRHVLRILAPHNTLIIHCLTHPTSFEHLEKAPSESVSYLRDHWLCVRSFEGRYKFHNRYLPTKMLLIIIKYQQSGASDLVCFVSEEMNLFKPFVFYMSKCVRLVPPNREYVKWDLTADRKLQAVICEFLFQNFDESGSNAVFLRQSLVPRNAHRRAYLTLS